MPEYLQKSSKLIAMQYQLREAVWEQDKDALRKIREIVFIQGQNVPLDLEWDDRDEHCWHVLVLDDDNPIATGRLDTNGKIGRMAVLDTYHGKGIGKLVLEKLIHIARREQIERTYMHAQVHALPFYLKNGFRAIGEIYEEAGIAHQNAEELLDSDKLVFSDAKLLLSKAIEYSDHQLKIKVTDINDPIFCDEDIVTAIRSKALKDVRYRIEILIEKSRPNKRSSDFVRAYQRLTDKIEIKRYEPPQLEPDQRQFILIDRQLIVWQPNKDTSDMRILISKNRIKQYHDDFDSLFGQSSRDLSLVKLYL